MLQFAIILLTFGTVGLLSGQYIPVLVEKIHKINLKRAEKLADKTERIFLKVRIDKMILFYLLSPIVLGGIGYFILHNLLGVLVGAGIALVIPSIYIKNLQTQRRTKFHKQLIDGLLLLSSSLKGGLSLIQALEIMVEEMPPPLSQEFGIVLSENKMGVSLEESFKRLYQRIPSPELNQMITAIILARETGGNLPSIFSRLVTTLRENTKIIQNIQTLTLQGRLQGTIMSALPIVFGIFVFTASPGFFNIMFESETGKALLIYSVISEVIGMILIRRISKISF
ncbi:MAG: type II secretion system F family protein [Candidatus Omnitrophota bacterium]|nr:type II secretion system F family protein [Candidatus Omnitrophota bacterium]